MALTPERIFGEVKVGETYIWEPDSAAREEVEVLEIKTNSDNEIWVNARSKNGEFWNDLDRFKEAVWGQYRSGDAVQIGGGLKWTRKAPVEAGWYWMKNVDGVGEVVQLRAREGESTLFIYQTGFRDTLRVDQMADCIRWAGPIPMPE